MSTREIRKSYYKEGVFSDKQRIEKRIYMEKCLVFLIPSDDSLHVRGGDNLIVMTLKLKLQAQEEGRGKNNAKIQRMKVEGPWRGRERESCSKKKWEFNFNLVLL